ncbi:MAG TPA: Amuc_1098 family type IV pilus outer membrane protein [Verrucomicrobiales bacterium]|nr:Amuc_1098 family type IV pilus outer membrane protein [Verrucomicrobiales bacterium]
MMRTPDFRGRTQRFQAAWTILLALSALPWAWAGPGDPGYYGASYSSEIAEREYVRRVGRIEEANAAYERGRQHYLRREYGQAVTEYRNALDLLPYAPATEEHRQVYLSGLSSAGVKYAEEIAREGRIEEARNLLEYILAERPEDKRTRKLLEQLDDPERYPTGYDAAHHDRVERVGDLLRRVDGSHMIGLYDKSDNYAEDALRIDRYNAAARRAMERNDNARMEYYKAAYNHTRAKYLGDIAQAWENPVADLGLTHEMIDPLLSAGGGIGYITAKLNEIIIPQIRLVNVTLREAVDYLREQSILRDGIETDNTKKGINIVIDSRAIGVSGSDALTRPITLTIESVPLVEALRYITDLAGVKSKIEAYSVVIVPESDEGGQMFTDIYRVPPSFLSIGGGGAVETTDDPFGAPSDGAGLGITRRQAVEVLKDAGVDFPDGSSAFFNPQTSQVVVHNTQKNLELVEQFVIGLIDTEVPKQVQIETKFVEVRQTNVKELGFDWLLSGFGWSSADDVLIGGGTGASQFGGVDYPVIDADGNPIGGGVVNGIPVGGGRVTQGLRTGSSAIVGSAIDALIANGRVGAVSGLLSPAPGVFSLAGILTDPQFQVVIRALDQKKGTDLLSAPNIVTKSGSPGKIEVIRELIYPTEYDPPELPQQVGATLAGGGGGGGGGPGTVATFPVTPATPTAFEVRNTGVTLEVTPVIGPDGYSIDLDLLPEIVEFEGFINYGSPITALGTDLLGNPIQVVVTENRIEMPVFATRKVTTAVTVWDCQTVAIGGLMREDVQHVQDKVPFLGDVPLLGRLFRSESEERDKRNLMVFVTAKLIDPAGNVLCEKPEEEEEEAPESLPPPITPPVTYGKGYQVK